MLSTQWVAFVCMGTLINQSRQSIQFCLQFHGPPCKKKAMLIESSNPSTTWPFLLLQSVLQTTDRMFQIVIWWKWFLLTIDYPIRPTDWVVHIFERSVYRETLDDRFMRFAMWHIPTRHGMGSPNWLIKLSTSPNEIMILWHESYVRNGEFIKFNYISLAWNVDFFFPAWWIKSYILVTVLICRLSSALWCSCWGHNYCYKSDKDCWFYTALHWVRPCYSCSCQREKLKCLGFPKAILFRDVACDSCFLSSCGHRCLDSWASDKCWIPWASSATTCYCFLVSIFQCWNHSLLFVS